MKIQGKVWSFGANVNTDLIFPKMYFRPQYEPGEMATRMMTGIDPDFPNKISRGDIIVAGPNFGCGSSREEAAASMREAGIGAVLAPSFSRLFMRNGINFGLPVLVLPDIDKHVLAGHEVEIDMAGRTLRNLTSGYEATLPPVAPESLRLLQDGGLKAYTQRILAERRAAEAAGPLP